MSDASLKESSSFKNFSKTLRNLERSTATPAVEPRDLSGVIKDFEMAYELSWNVLKKALLLAGHQTLGAKDVYTKAFHLGYLDDEQTWLKMIADRNFSAHVYDEKDARRIAQNVTQTYLPALKKLEQRLSNQ